MMRSEWAARIWPLLTYAARNRQTVTYGVLAKHVGQMPPALGQCLEPIQSYCLLKRLPPLSILVVNQETGVPGSGFVAAQDIPGKQAEVFDHDWLKTPVPSPSDLEVAVKDLPSNGNAQALTR